MLRRTAEQHWDPPCPIWHGQETKPHKPKQQLNERVMVSATCVRARQNQRRIMPMQHVPQQMKQRKPPAGIHRMPMMPPRKRAPRRIAPKPPPIEHLTTPASAISRLKNIIKFPRGDRTERQNRFRVVRCALA